MCKWKNSKVLIKLAATWEGIAAMKELEAEAMAAISLLRSIKRYEHLYAQRIVQGITCNMTLVFGFVAVLESQFWTW